MNKYLEKIAAQAEEGHKKPGLARHAVTAAATGAAGLAAGTVGHGVGTTAGLIGGISHYGKKFRQEINSGKVHPQKAVENIVKGISRAGKVGGVVGAGLVGGLGAYGAYKLARPKQG